MILFSSFAVILSTQAAFGLSFASSIFPLFITFVLLQSMQKSSLFPRAASINRASMLVASFSSSSMGFVIANVFPIENASIPALRNTSSANSIKPDYVNGTDLMWTIVFTTTFISKVSSFIIVVISFPYLCKVEQLAVLRASFQLCRSSTKSGGNNKEVNDKLFLSDASSQHALLDTSLAEIDEKKKSEAKVKQSFSLICSSFCYGQRPKNIDASVIDVVSFFIHGLHASFRLFVKC